MYEKNVIPEKQALNSQKRLFYPVSQPSLNEIADIFLCVYEIFRGKFRNDVLRGDILLLTYIELRLNKESQKWYRQAIGRLFYLATFEILTLTF
tara:strand:- start:14902 stop:15183 length:282 start_codon:yes stop_codon:yes gene_type:complete